MEPRESRRERNGTKRAKGCLVWFGLDSEPYPTVEVWPHEWGESQPILRMATMCGPDGIDLPPAGRNDRPPPGDSQNLGATQHPCLLTDAADMHRQLPNALKPTQAQPTVCTMNYQRNIHSDESGLWKRRSRQYSPASAGYSLDAGAVIPTNEAHVDA